MLHTIPQTVAVRLPACTITADAVLAGIEGQLPPNAKRLFTLLFETALHALSSQGHTLMPNQQVIHQPVEVMAAALDLSKVTVYKHLVILKQYGLVDSRGHTASWFGLSRKTGTLFSVSLKPGHRARLRFDDLKFKHRDLEAATQSGTRTAYRFPQGLQPLPKLEKNGQGLTPRRHPGLGALAADNRYFAETTPRLSAQLREQFVDGDRLQAGAKQHSGKPCYGG